MNKRTRLSFALILIHSMAYVLIGKFAADGHKETGIETSLISDIIIISNRALALVAYAYLIVESKPDSLTFYKNCGFKELKWIRRIKTESGSSHR
jgi:hypothetical protein